MPDARLSFLAPLQAPIHLMVGNHDDRAAFRRVEIRDGERRHWLHFLDRRVVPEPAPPAIPIYVR